jgi:hypothetical protein
MSSDRVEILRSAYEEYSETHKQMHEIQQNLNDKAIEIAKINLLVGGIAASVVTIQPQNISLVYFTVGIITLLASIFYSGVVYSQTKTYDVGIASKSVDDMVSKDDVEEHYQHMAKEYSGMVGDFKEPYEDEKDDFEKALWLAISTTFLFIAGAGSTVLNEVLEIQYPRSIDFVVTVIIGILLMYGKTRNEATETKD